MKILIVIILLLVSFTLTNAGIEDFDNILFIHRSVGANLIRYGDVYGLIEQYNKEHGTELVFWDHGYSSLTDGKKGFQPYGIVNHNTNPDGYNSLFTQEISGLNDNAMSKIMAKS